MLTPDWAWKIRAELRDKIYEYRKSNPKAECVAYIGPEVVAAVVEWPDQVPHVRGNPKFMATLHGAWIYARDEVGITVKGRH